MRKLVVKFYRCDGRTIHNHLTGAWVASEKDIQEYMKQWEARIRGKDFMKQYLSRTAYAITLDKRVAYGLVQVEVSTEADNNEYGEVHP